MTDWIEFQRRIIDSLPPLQDWQNHELTLITQEHWRGKNVR